MTISGIISVSGIPGLHKILSHTKSGLIVESLLDGKRRPIYASQKFSALEDISIYTNDDDVPLTDVFKKIFDKEKGKPSLDHKSKPQELRDYLTGLVEDLDQERVYNSDISKLFQWYNILIDKDLLNEEEEDAKEAEDQKSDTPKKAAPKKKKTTPKGNVKKAAAPKKAPNKPQATTRKASGRKA